ncbi:MAG TPA: DUF5362 family protein [Chitinophagaceae bacterium]|jgi:hypothetical protein|nr:DUF5362 family protein [Chitinophagaceae bacterium]
MEQEQNQSQHQHTPLDLNPTTSLFQMNLDAHNSYNLRSASSWARVLGVCGAITGSFLIVLMLILLSKVNEISRYGGYSYRRRSGFSALFSGQDDQLKLGAWIMIITGIIFLVGGIFSYHFGNKITAALRANDQNGLNNGFAALRNYFAVRAITVILIMIILLMNMANTL